MIRSATPTRRKVWALVPIFTFVLLCTEPGESQADEKPLPLWAQPVVLYLESLAKESGGYGWNDQPFGHISATWAVIGTYQIVGREPPNREQLSEFVRTHHPFDGSHPRSIAHAAELRSFVFQQVQSLRWLDASTDGFDQLVTKWSEPSEYPTFYELRGYPLFQEEVLGLLTRELLGMDFSGVSTALQSQISKRIRPNGSFNNTAASDRSDGHVVNTLWGLLATQLYRDGINHRDKLVTWLRDCQSTDGGFAASPAEAESRSALYFAWAAIRSLKLCGSEPRDVSRCVRFLLRHWQDEGGFSWYEGGAADPLATYYALDALSRLSALDSLKNYLRQPKRARDTIPDGLKVVSMQLNAPGVGSPTELVRLARSLRIDHWVTRNGADGYREELERVAREYNVPVVFDKAQEDFMLHLNVPGQGDYARISLLLTPNRVAELDRFLDRSMNWSDYRPQRRRSMDSIDGVLVWNVCDNELYARTVFDDSLAAGGIDAISVFHFGGWDLLVNFPWLRNYSGRLPFVALSNAQGGQAWWWADRLASFRTLYLAEAPSWEAWKSALENNWVVAVRYDQALQQPVIYGGSPATRQFISEHQDEWAWWGNSPATVRPAVSLVAVQPDDPFEAPKNESGIVLRARTWWWTDAAGFQKTKRSELTSMWVDGKEVSPKFVEHRNLKDKLVDCYYRFDLPKLSPGKHIATAEVEVLSTGKTHSQSIEFEVVN